MPEMCSEADLNQQQRLKCAFDAEGLLNPGKVFPVLHRCAELGRTIVRGGKLRFAELPRFEWRKGVRGRLSARRMRRSSARRSRLRTRPRGRWPWWAPGRSARSAG